MARDTPDGAVLVDVVSGGCWELNGVGAACWSLLDKPTTLRSVCEALRTRYNVALEVLERDVLAIAGELSKSGLVRKPAARAADAR